MKRIYIAGPISKGSLAHNINQATDAFIELAKLGYAPFCPHWSVYARKCIAYGVGVTCFGSAMPNELTHEQWLALDLEWVSVSDAVLRLPGESVGADMEVAHAKEKGIPVYCSVTDLHTWEG